MKKRNKGIALITLIVTIIILLILVGITIVELTESGLIEKVKLARQKSENSYLIENELLEDYSNKIGYVDGTRDMVTLTTEQYNSIINRLEELEEKTQIKSERLNSENKSSNTIYEAETDGFVYIRASVNPHFCYIDVYDIDGNILYGDYTYIGDGGGIDSGKTVYVPKGYKWKAYSDGGAITVKWISF